MHQMAKSGNLLLIIELHQESKLWMVWLNASPSQKAGPKLRCLGWVL